MCKPCLAGLLQTARIMGSCPAQLATHKCELRKTPTTPSPITFLMPPCAKDEEDLELLIYGSLDVYSDRANSISAKQLPQGLVSFTGAGQCPSYSSFSPALSTVPAQPIHAGTCVCSDGWMSEWCSEGYCVYFLCALCPL